MINSVLRYGLLSQGVWTPASIANLTAWYSELVNNGIDRSTLSNGAAITQWDDKSGNAFHLNTVIGTPKWDATISAMDFDTGGVYNMNHPIVTGATKHTAFVVTRAGSMSINNDAYFIGQYDAIPTTPADHYSELKLDNSSYATIDIGNTYRRFTTTNANDTFYLMTGYFTGTSISQSVMRKNGVQLSVNATGNNLSLNLDTGLAGGGGYLNGATQAMVNRGDVQNKELIIYNRELTLSEIQQVENYLNTKYSIY